ncbi:hypothetical protein F7734_17415 [Scytonema sp. UIC 10036]|uniref:hypothetical protein n=1 Tax=Scytonema sp. UIC 10036 TaxID=2304196 RepID=UPI0012DAAA55|nr:hypothetical protein [Scytonema sp. UIC 10036]MUG94072.1 hypothetical protein [Scytonema sp. UIC 10036]
MTTSNYTLIRLQERNSRDSTNFAAFQLPQMILKLSWQKNNGRFRSVIIQANDTQDLFGRVTIYSLLSFYHKLTVVELRSI